MADQVVPFLALAGGRVYPGPDRPRADESGSGRPVRQRLPPRPGSRRHAHARGVGPTVAEVTAEGGPSGLVGDLRRDVAVHLVVLPHVIVQFLARLEPFVTLITRERPILVRRCSPLMWNGSSAKDIVVTPTPATAFGSSPPAL
ncbi:hypothetical protein ACFQL0_16750 [Haloplanus litoreus]|uniref:hypothetical protein n=1 Tax=Haloplanus litoreus TaxID=767515 RepID=UPI00360A912E